MKLVPLSDHISAGKPRLEANLSNAAKKPSVLSVDTNS